MNPNKFLLHNAFQIAVSRYPERVAVSDHRDSLTYKELDLWSNALSSQLINLGVQVGSAVAVSAERSVGFTAAILAVLKAGAAYVPLDPAYPVDRLTYCMEQSRSTVLITDGSVPELEQSTQVLQLKQLADIRSENPPIVTISEDSPAYIIFTSGSTGRPKGVVVPHRAIVNHMNWMSNEFKWSPDDVFLQKTAAGFDASVWEFHAPISSGARMIIGTSNPFEMVTDIEKHGVTIVQFVPTVLNILKEQQLLYKCKSLRLLFCGGEALTTSLVQEVQREVNVPIVNLYGPTEAAIDTTFRICMPGELHKHREIDLGNAIPNVSIYVVDEMLRTVGLDEEGELVISGIGLADGYCGLPEVTAERFVTLPANGERIYRTGDHVRVRSTGEIVFVGRQDFQLKLRGQRMESGEIEAVLRKCEGVYDALVTVQEEAEEQWLVAYVRTNLQQWDEQKIREVLNESLPSYMIPSFYVPLAEFPYLENGKLDRKTLVTIPFRKGRDTGTSLEGVWEERIASVWSELLGHPIENAKVSFIAVGGHSLLAMRLAGRLTAMTGLTLDHGFVLRYPTIRDQACYFMEQNLSLEVLVSKSKQWVQTGGIGGNELVPLSYGQQGILFFEESSNASAYHIAYALDIKAGIKEEVIVHSINSLLERHSMLTVTIDLGETGEYVQRSEPSLSKQLVSIIRVSVEGLNEALRTNAEKKFNLQRDGGFRVVIYETPSGYTLLLVFHHLIADGWSVQLLLDELHDALSPKENHIVEDSSDHQAFMQFAREQRNKNYDKPLEYWKRSLEGVPQTSRFPNEMRIGSVQTSKGGRLNFTIPHELERRIEEYGRKVSLSEFSLQLASVSSVLAGYNGQRDLCIGVPSANRRSEDEFKAVGNFVNVIPFRIQFPEGATLREVASDIARTYLDLMPYEDTPIELIIPAVKHHRSDEYRPLFQVMFTYNNFLHKQSHTQFETNAILSDTAKCDISFIVERCGDQAIFILEYCEDLFALETVETIRDEWIAAMEKLIHTDDEVLIQVRQYQMMQESEMDVTEQPADPLMLDRVLELWGRMFPNEEVGVNSNFFRLGGHSLLAMKMMATVNSMFEMDLPVSTLLKYPTVQGLAHVITYKVKPTGVVPLAASEGKPKLWFIHPAGGALWCYREMAGVLGEQFDVWGIESEPVPESGRYEDDLVSMARRYAGYIQSVQKNGPYYVCGYSFGGNVAFEIMRTFHEQGEEGMLTLIDCHLSRPRSYKDVEFIISYASKFVEGNTDRLNPEELMSMDDMALYEYLLNLGKAGGHLHVDAGLDDVKKGLQIWQANNKAVHRYEMMVPYYGKTLFIRAAQNEEDTSVGWDSYLLGEVQKEAVLAHHFTIYKSPNAEECGRKIMQQIIGLEEVTAG